MVCLKKNTSCSPTEDDEIIIVTGRSSNPVVFKLLDPVSSQIIGIVSKKIKVKSLVFKPYAELRKFITVSGNYVLQIFHEADFHQMNMKIKLSR